MLRAGRFTAAGAACLVAAVALLAPDVAVAAPGGAGPVSFAALAAKPNTFTSQYSCDLSGYGTGIAPVTISATLAFSETVQALSPLGITLTTTSASLPSTVLSKLTGVTSFGVSEELSATEAGESATVPISGTIPVSGTLTGVPAGKATGSIAFPVAGKGAIQVPAPALTFTPNVGSTAQPVITCAPKAAAKNVAITVTQQVIGTKGPLYECLVKIADVSASALIHIPMTVTSSGTRTTGKTDTVTLVVGLGGPYPAGTTSIEFSSDLPVTGAQAGTIALSTTVTDLKSTVTRASGKLRLTAAGTDKILVPEKFTLSLDLAESGLLVPVVFTCAIKTHPVPVGLTIKVSKAAGQPQPTSSPTGTPSNGGQPEGSGTPSGAPETGGGTGPGADLAVAAAGMAIAFSGGGMVVLGRRRRRK